MKELLYKTFEDLLADLNEREVDIIKRRFGIEKDHRESLDKIGRAYNLTRERVRQIQNSLLNKLKIKSSSNEFIKKIYREVETCIGNIPIKREVYIFKTFSNNYFLNEDDLKILRLFLVILPRYFYHKETKIYHPFLSREEFFKGALSILNNLHIALNKKIFNEEEFLNFLEDNIKKVFRVSADADELYELAKILKNLGKNPLNEIGSINHKRISPSSIIDKIYIIFKLEKRPMHFTEVYDKLNKIAEIEDELIHDRWRKNYSIQSVLNTLISNEKFVWHGRGIYGLKEDGYRDGKIIELMKKIVKKYNGIKKDKLFEILSKEKILSKNTFNVYIQKYFKKIDDKIYLR
ncbi:MAG: sigma factor-like helix-turn-helix DNA-binding protein [Minisyncoccia bacterium]